MAKPPIRPSRIAPGLLRKPVVSMPPVSGGAEGVPLTLTRRVSAAEWPVGLLTPSGRTPWGCLFFSLVGLVILIWLLSNRLAVLLGLVGLIIFWASFNHPRRTSADAVRRTLRLVGARSGKRAWQALSPALKSCPDDEGLHYIAALVSLLTGRSTRALEHLEQARPRLGEFAEFHHLLARSLRDLDRPEAAGKAYLQALDFPAYPSRNLLLAEAQAHFERQGDPAALAALADITDQGM